MKHDEKERKNQWKMMNKREKTMKTDYIKICKKQWKIMKQRKKQLKNEEKEKNTMKNDEK